MNPAVRSQIVEESTRHMAAGLAAIGQGNWNQALFQFDLAGALRENLPWHTDGEAAWLLAAAWINRGDMLQRLGEFMPAISAFDRTIEAMRHVPILEKPVFVERLILAWINRGAACGDEEDFREALASFSEAQNLLFTHGADETPERNFLAAMLRTNGARVLVQMKRALPAWEESREAVRILKMLYVSPEVVHASIRARGIQCQALALLLDEPDGAALVGDWIAEATDAAEEALAWARAADFKDSWVSDLVRYGAKIYQRCQPQFLGAFVSDWLGKDGLLRGDECLKTDMQNLILLARFELEHKILLLPQDTDFVAKQLRILKELQKGEAAIA